MELILIILFVDYNSQYYFNINYTLDASVATPTQPKKPGLQITSVFVCGEWTFNVPQTSKKSLSFQNFVRVISIQNKYCFSS